MLDTNQYKSRTTSPPLVSHDGNLATVEAVMDFAITEFSDKTNYGGVMGLARDGHVI